MAITAEARNFDLNIEKILEGWETCHAIRELIANALDEQALSGIGDVEITEVLESVWHIRDSGRGLKYEHLTQNESLEKLQNPGRVIGKFGVGLKDALAISIGVELAFASIRDSATLPLRKLRNMVSPML